MEILVDERCGATVGAAEDIDGEVDERLLEGSPAERVARRHLLGPPNGLVGREPEGMRLGGFPPQPEEELRDDRRLVGGGIPKSCPGTAALDEERPLVVRSCHDPDGSAPVPPHQRVGFMVGLEVRRCVHLEHDVAGRHDERVRSVDRLFESEIPLDRELTHHAGKLVEPRGLALPHLREAGRKLHRPGTFARPWNGLSPFRGLVTAT